MNDRDVMIAGSSKKRLYLNGEKVGIKLTWKQAHKAALHYARWWLNDWAEPYEDYTVDVSDITDAQIVEAAGDMGWDIKIHDSGFWKALSGKEADALQ